MEDATIILAIHAGYELVQYRPSGEVRIEHAASRTCSAWLSHRDVAMLADNPHLMASWPCDEDMD